MAKPKRKLTPAEKHKLRLAFRISVVIGAFVACSGCDPSSAFTFPGASKTATEDRDVTAPEHVAGSGIDVQTPVGSIDIASDPSLKEIKVTARVSASGKNDEEARARLKDVRIKVSRRADSVLEIAAELPNTIGVQQGSCSFVVRVPDAKGARIKSGNGSLTIKGLGGAAELDTGIGSITVVNQDGNIAATTGNGSIYVTKASGEVRAGTRIGGIKIDDASGSVNAKSGNGSIEVKKVGGDVTADTSIGSISIYDAASLVTATGGNGSITISGARGVKAKTSIGGIKIENADGQVDADSGNGSITFKSAQDSDPSFKLNTSVGAVTVHLHANATGSIDAGTSVGSVTINGNRKPDSVIGERNSKKIVLKGNGPESRIHCGNGSITITLD